MKLAKSLTAALMCLIMACSMCVSALAYNDVTLDDKSAVYIEFVDRLGILPSTWNGDFNPEQYLSRSDAIVAVYKMINGSSIDAALYKDTPLDFLATGDSGDIEEDSVLRAYLAWAVDNYLITTKVENSKFLPAEAITANEFMTLLAKVLRLSDESDSYPDDYTSKVADIVGDIEAGTKPVTRKQAAVALSNAIVSADGEAYDLGVYVDDDGKALDSLAVKVFHMSNVELIIRATTNRPLGYNVKNGTLLSNGADVNLNSDLSEYVGYGITVTYRDGDNSGTYTEDEEILTYTISSTITSTVPLSKLSITAGNAISATTESASFGINTATYMYLNDDPWPLDDPKYDLVKLVPAIGKVSTVSNRENMRFKCMAPSSSATYLATVFATEAKPGKILGINKGYYSVFDYYYAGTSEEVKTYNIAQCVFAGPVAVGDYVNFYESSGKCYFTAGNTLLSGVASKTTGGYTLTDGTEVIEHLFYRPGDDILAYSTDAATATKYQLIMDDSGANELITWEKYRTNNTLMIIEELSTGTDRHTIKAKKLADGTVVTFTVLFDNVDSTAKLNVGDVINYTDNGVETNPVTYVQKNAPKTLTVTDRGDYFEDTTTDPTNPQKYYKNANYMGNIGTGGDFTTGVCTLNLDIANCVVSIVY